MSESLSCPVSQSLFRDGAARLGAAVSVITTAGQGGRCGFTASAVCSVTDTPPMLLVCMNRGSHQHRAFTTNRALCVNVLASDQDGLSATFAGQRGLSMDQRFDSAAWDMLVTGAPALLGATVCLDCRITEVIARGTHSIFLVEVEMVRLGDDSSGGLIWFDRDYHSVGATTGAQLR